MNSLLSNSLQHRNFDTNGMSRPKKQREEPGKLEHQKSHWKRSQIFPSPVKHEHTLSLTTLDTHNETTISTSHDNRHLNNTITHLI